MKNSKISFAIVFFLAVMHIVTAQEKSEYKLGFKGGVNFTNVGTTTGVTNKSLTGVHFGLFAKLPITNSFAVQPELYFTTKGGELTYQNVVVDGTAKFNLNYIEVPVLAVFKIFPGFNFQVGPYASYLVSSKVTNVNDVTFNFEDNIQSGDFNKFDTGLMAGFGIDIKSVEIGVRYNFGLLKVGKDKTYLGTNYIFPDGKNSAINAYVSYSIF
jgi:hypothetical protein